MKRYVIKSTLNGLYLNTKVDLYLNNNSILDDLNKARVFNNKQSASCAWSWAMYGTPNYLNSEIIEIELKIK